MLNIDLGHVDMPKIKPETRKCWSSRLKSNSPTEVADIFNVSKRQVERIRKRYQETGDVHDRPRSCREACCPETSAKQETAKKPCCLHQDPQPDGRLDSRKCDFQINRQLSSIPSAANIVNDPQGPVWPHGSPRRQIMVWGYIQYGGAREICKVDGNIDSAKYLARVLPLSTFPTTRGVRFFNGWSFLPYLRFHYDISQGEEDQGPSGMASTVSRYEYYWAYLGKNEGGSLEDQAEELGGALGCLQGGLPCHPWWLLNDEILDWFFICYFIYFLRKIKYIDYNLIDYYSRQDFCPGRNWLVHHYQAIHLISIY